MNETYSHEALPSLDLSLSKKLDDLSITKPAATMVSQYDPSEWEKANYYHGVSSHPPELLYRSNYLSNPFPHPKGRFHHIFPKTAHGVYNTRLNNVWHIVAPRIRDGLKSHHKIRYSAIQAARFITHGERGLDRLGPVVIWIAVHPNSTTAEDAHSVSGRILNLLGANRVDGVVVEWIEGTVERMGSNHRPGPPLLPITEQDNATYYVRRFLTARLGMPIARVDDSDAQGSVAFFFHENRDRRGNPSNRVLAVSCCHVLRQDTTVSYKFAGIAKAPADRVRLAGSRRFKRGVDEITATIQDKGEEGARLAQEIRERQAELNSNDQQAVRAAENIQVQSAKVMEDIAALADFYRAVETHWSSLESRIIGHIDWAPKITVDPEPTRYTKDIGTFEVDAVKFGPGFKGNVVDLGLYCLVFLVIASPDKVNLQGQNIVQPSLPASSIPTFVAGILSDIQSEANSESTAGLRASTWLVPILKTAMVTPVLLS